MISRWRGGSGTEPGDRGSVTMYTVLIAPVVLLLAGLLVDGGLAIHARQRADDIAEQTARAGANDIDQDNLRRTGQVQLADDQSVQSACDRLATAYGQIDGMPVCQVSADRRQVRASVQISVRPKILGLIGIGVFHMRGQASARPDEGN